MSDTPPDRLSVNPNNKYYDADVLQRGVGIRFKGEEKTNVDEYCVSEGWVRLAVGKAVDARLKTIIAQVNAELTGERTTLDNEAKALDAKKTTMEQGALEQQAAGLQVKANAWQRKGQLRQKEVEATEQKALSRVYQELDPAIKQVYQQRTCGILIDRESVLLANPAMDITDAVVVALDARIKTLTFDRERLDQPAAGAQALTPTKK